jgi:acetylglutamate kinase
VTATKAPTVLKFGGELLESPDRLACVVSAVAQLAAQGPLVVVHGGGREIDAECKRRGIEKRSVDGLRVTDAATLDAVVAVLAGTINTRLVARLGAAGVRAVGLTGADANMPRVRKAPPHAAVDGRLVDLGLVGEPDASSPAVLLLDLIALGYVPVVACLGADDAGTLYNVNADTLASRLAVACRAVELIVGGATAGVLDDGGATIAQLDLASIDTLIGSGTASAGMVAKLVACRDAIRGGVGAVTIVDGRSEDGLLERVGTRVCGNRFGDPQIRKSGDPVHLA